MDGAWSGFADDLFIKDALPDQTADPAKDVILNNAASLDNTLAEDRYKQNLRKLEIVPSIRRYGRQGKAYAHAATESHGRSWTNVQLLHNWKVSLARTGIVINRVKWWQAMTAHNRQLDQQNRRQLRRTASRTKRDGGASGSTTVVPKPKADIKVEQKSLNKIMIKAILKTHQTIYLGLTNSLQQRGNTVGT